MTVEEKAKMIEKHCNSMPSCSACPIGNKDGSFVCFSDWEDYPNDIEKNYEIIFGNAELVRKWGERKNLPPNTLPFISGVIKIMANGEA